MAKKESRTKKTTGKTRGKTNAGKRKKPAKRSAEMAGNAGNNVSEKNIIFELKLIVFFLLSIALAMSVHGLPMGIVGEAVRDLLSGLFSVSMYFIPYFFMAWVLIFSITKFRESKKRYLLSLLVLFLAQTLLLGFYTRANAVPLSFRLADIGLTYTNGTKFIGAGLIGNLIFVPLYSLLGYTGMILCIIALAFIFLLLASRFTFSGMIRYFGRSVKRTGEKAAMGGKRIGENISDFQEYASENDCEVKSEEYEDEFENFSALKTIVEARKNKKIQEDTIPDNMQFLHELGGFGEFNYQEAMDKERYPEDFDDRHDFYGRNFDEEKISEFKFIDIPDSLPKENEGNPETLSEEREVAFTDEPDPEEERSNTEFLPFREDRALQEEHLEEQGEEKIEEKSSIKDSDDEEKERKTRGLDDPKPVETKNPEDDENYILPSFELLLKGENIDAKESQHAMANKAAILEETFKSFKVEAEVTSAVQGPMITRFEVKPKAGVKISKISALNDDIAMRLAATNVRILAPIPGKSAVGIEVPNEHVSIVRLRDVLESENYKKQKSKIRFGLGKDISGEEIVADLAKMPHLLIAGATGSGKSVCVNTIISSILFNAKPSEVKFLMIDPKVVELSVYNGIPHLLLPVVTDPNKASVALSWAVNEMTQRYAKFAEYRVRDISSYNEKYREWKRERLELEAAEEDLRENGILEEEVDERELNQEFYDSIEDADSQEESIVYKVKNEEAEDEVMEFMPRIVIIIDELADLMVVAGKQVEESIARLAQMARAAGMHLIVATQRPSVDVITGLIKANIPSRIAFAVSSQIDSRTILDEQGADKLLGKGDMLFLNAGKSKPTRVQGAFITDHEVEDLVNYVKQQFDGELDYNEAVVDISNLPAMSAENDEDSDELLEEAIQFVINSEKASTSMIQRKFRIGYNRAARIVEEMEERGIVGPSRGAKPREVLISSGVWESENNDA